MLESPGNLGCRRLQLGHQLDETEHVYHRDLNKQDLFTSGSGYFKYDLFPPCAHNKKICILLFNDPKNKLWMK